MVMNFASSWRRVLMLLALAWMTPVFAAHDLNMPVGVTELSAEIYALHMKIFWWCVAIAIVVFGVMIYSIATFRKSKGAVADVKLTHSHKVEVIWTIVPILILVVMAIPAAKTLIQIEDTRNTELSIKVTAYQWKWHYDYLDKGVSYFSQLAQTSNAARQLGSGIDPKTVDHYLLDVDHPLVVPEGTKVRLLLTANDVIHAWWVPDFGMKKDAIPGFVNEMWFKVDEGKAGFYRGQCAELCGRDHGFMPIVVEVKTKADFASWLEEQKAAAKPAEPATAATSDSNLTTTVAQTP
jgi:cytochrome c oxidase subunit II